VDYLLDTNTLSALIETNQSIVSRVDRIAPAEYVYSSVITEGELLFGLVNTPPSRRPPLAERIKIGLAAMAQIIPLTSPVADAYSNIRYHLKVTGQPLPDNDIWIAAVAMANGYILVSHDAAFTHIPGLKLEDWLA